MIDLTAACERGVTCICGRGFTEESVLMRAEAKSKDRRTKTRFGIRRELRYKLFEENNLTQTGSGYTIDIGSGGVAFTADRPLSMGTFVELSISWPVLLEESCPMRLSIFGRILRSGDDRVVCSVDKYEFRTQSRSPRETFAVRQDSMLERWAEAIRRGQLRAGVPA